MLSEPVAVLCAPVAVLHGPVAVLDEGVRAILPSAEPALGAVQEVARVAVDVEPDEVGREHAAKEVLVPGEQAEHVVGREGDVEEEGHGGRHVHLAEERGHQHQVVVLHPDQIVGSDALGDRLGETLVHRSIGVPVASVEAGAFVE